MNLSESLHAILRMGAFLFLCLPLMAAPIEVPHEPFDKLKAEDFNVREHAQQELLTWGRKSPEAATDAFYAKFRSSTDPEQQQRTLDILRELVGDQFMRDGEGFIGISMEETRVAIPEEKARIRGIKIKMILQGFAADNHGLKVNDVIISCESKRMPEGVSALNWLPSIVTKKAPGTKVNFEVLRGSDLIAVAVVLSRRPPNADQLLPPDQHLKDIQKAREKHFQRWLESRLQRN